MLKHFVKPLVSEIFFNSHFVLPIPEAICMPWGLTIDKTFSRRPNTANRGESTGYNKRTFIYSNQLPPGFKADRKHLKIGLTTINGQNFQRHFFYETDLKICHF